MKMSAAAQPIPNKPALFLSRKKILVVADLHIGIENELRELGVYVPSQTSTITQRLIHLIEKYNPKEIILLGDIKHNIPSSTIRERKDVEKFIDTIESYATIHILPGNHDGNIGKLLTSSVTLHPSDGFVFEDMGFIHGHRWPSQKIMQCKQIIMGHTHPTIMLTDRLGYKMYEPCWIQGNFIVDKLKERYSNSKKPSVLIMPAFNPLCGGVAANKETLVGPISKIIDVPNAQVYLLDGTALGKVKDI